MRIRNFLIFFVLLTGCSTLKPAVEPISLKENPEADAYYEKALTYYNGGKYDLAEPLLIELIKKYSSSTKVPAAQFLLSRIYYNLKDYERSIIASSDLIKNFPRSIYKEEAMVILGNCYRNKGENLKSAEIYFSVYTTTQDSSIRVRLIHPLKRLIKNYLSETELKGLLKKFSKSDVSEWLLFTLATKEFELKHFTEARKYLEEFLSRFPKSEDTGKAKEMLAQTTKPKTTESVSVKIGLICPLTGKYENYGQAVKEAVELALENDDSGKRVNLITVDSKGDPIVTLLETRNLIEKENVLALIGEVISMPTIVAAIEASNKQVAIISPTATEERISQIGNTIFQLNVASENQASLVANYAIRSLRLYNFAILYPNESKAIELANEFSDEILRLGGKIVAKEKFKKTMTDFRGPINRIHAANPQAIFIPAEPDEIVMIAPQIAYYGLKVQILGSDGWNSQQVVDLGESYVEGAIFSGTSVGLENPVSSQSFKRNFFNKYHKEPSVTNALGYDAMCLLLSVIRNGANDRGEIIDALKSTKNYQGVTGMIDLSKNRAAKQLILLTIRNKQIIPIR